MKIKSALLKYWNNKKFIKQNLIAWLSIFSLFTLIQFFFTVNAGFSSFMYIALATFVIMIIFYLNFIICELFFSKKMQYLVASFLFYVLFIGLNFLEESARIDANRPSLFFILFLVSVYYILIVSLSSLYWSLVTSSANKKKNKELQVVLQHSNDDLHRKNLLLENQLLSTEIKFLRAQINPHFLFNTLNFFYSEMLDAQPKVADGIMVLSQIMRYSLQDFSKSGGFAELSDELEHVQNVIKIHQMRFSNKLYVALDLKCEEENVQIVPMVLITLVENVFKHGNLQDSDFPAVILCKTDPNKKMIYFSTFNKKKKGIYSNGNHAGLGINNIRHRLEQLYQNNFSMKVTDELDSYKVELEFPLHEKMLVSLVLSAQTYPLPN
ncbi:MAG: sensor histidine kinase [Ginsengibacter sp.]